MPTNAIEVRGVSKRYRLPTERPTRLLERLVSPFSRSPHEIEIVQALEDVTFDVAEGSVVGIIGANGSGKSTLLKVMAKILSPDRGTVCVQGTAAALLELGLGFHRDLTVRENAALYSAVLGCSRRDTPARVQQIVEYAELQRFRDAKLKTLSSGMMMRLAFATTLFADADVLLLDEVLAVGDARFQQKCLEAFQERRKLGTTIVLVAHDLITVRRLCDAACWLDQGRVAAFGEAPSIVDLYVAGAQRFGLSDGALAAGSDPAAHRIGDGFVRWATGTLDDETGTQVSTLRSGQRATLTLIAEAQARVSPPTYGMRIRQGPVVLYDTNSTMLGVRTEALDPGDRVEVRITFSASLAGGQYVIDLAIAAPHDHQLHDWVSNAILFTVENDTVNDGLVDLAADLQARRTSPSIPGRTEAAT